MTNNPLVQILVRNNEGLSVASGLNGENHPNFSPVQEGAVRGARYSANGEFFAYSTGKNELLVINSATGECVRKWEEMDVQEFSFSPNSKYICIFEKYFKSDNPKNNLHVIQIDSNRSVFSCLQKNYRPNLIQWSQNGDYFARLVNGNQVNFYQLEKLLEEGASNQETYKLSLDGLADFSISPCKDSLMVAVFIAERKGYPASIRIYQVPSFNVPVAQKNFYKADKVDLLWNKNGSNLLALTQTEVDKSGKSYYGESNLYLLSARGGFDARVMLDKEGPVHDVLWSPNGKDFLVVYGFMPAKSVLYDSKCKMVFDFGTSHRNTAKFNPQGRLLCLAGFGNLAGDMDFWDLQAPLKKIASVQDSGTTTFEWTLDGKHLITSTLSPRLRVDNGYKVWHYHGYIKFKQDYKELYQVLLRPPSKDDSIPPLRELSPPPANRPGSGAASVTSANAAPVKAAYVPPHQRAKLAASASASTSNNNNNNNSKGNSASSAAKLPSNTFKKVVIPNSSSSSPTDATTTSPGAANGSSRKKNLEKKLKQIAQLKERVAKGETLEEAQLVKIQSEAKIKEELSTLA